MLHDQHLVDRLSGLASQRFDGEVFRATGVSYDLGKSSECNFASNLNAIGGPPFFAVNTTRFAGHIVRAGLNYKFWYPEV